MSSPKTTKTELFISITDCIVTNICQIHKKTTLNSFNFEGNLSHMKTHILYEFNVSVFAEQ